MARLQPKERAPAFTGLVGRPEARLKRGTAILPGNGIICLFNQCLVAPTRQCDNLIIHSFTLIIFLPFFVAPTSNVIYSCFQVKCIFPHFFVLHFSFL